jgi:hypothetical protein
MSRGVFTIIDSYLGRQEMILTARDHLARRLSTIAAISGQYTIADIEKTHDVFVKATFRPHVAFAQEYFKTMAESGNNLQLGRGDSENKILFNLKSNNGTLLSDMSVRIVLDAIEEKTSGPLLGLRWRYCDWPGLRLTRKIEFSVDKTLIDEYYSEDQLFYMRHRLDAHKRPGYNRLVGQAEPSVGQTYVGGLGGEYSVEDRILSGAQTFKSNQPKLELWIPLIFWFNLNIEQPFRNSLVPSEQKYITVNLAPLQDMVQASDIAGTDVALGPDALNAFPSLKVVSAELYAKNIYMPPDVQDAFQLKKELLLIRVHRRHVQQLSTHRDNVLLSQLKHPIEYMHFGIRPNVNLGSFYAWNKFATVQTGRIPRPVIVPGLLPNTFIFVVRQSEVNVLRPVVDSIGFKIGENDWLASTPVALFKDVIPLALPSQVSTLPSNNDDVGSYFVSFAHKPGTFQPSGHFNSSVGREFYLTYDSTEDRISSGLGLGAQLYVSAYCLNFIIMDGFTMRIKYIT